MMIRQCCECRKVCQDGRWVTEPARLPKGERVSHGYCPTCAKAALKAVEDHYASLAASGASA